MPYILTRDMSFLAFSLYKALHLFFLWFSCDSPGAWPSDWLQSWERWRSTQARPSCQQALSASQSWGYDNEKVTNYKASFGKWTCWYLMGSTASLTCYWAGVLLLGSWLLGVEDMYLQKGSFRGQDEKNWMMLQRRWHYFTLVLFTDNNCFYLYFECFTMKQKRNAMWELTSTKAKSKNPGKTILSSTLFFDRVIIFYSIPFKEIKYLLGKYFSFFPWSLTFSYKVFMDTS